MPKLNRDTSGSTDFDQIIDRMAVSRRQYETDNSLTTNDLAINSRKVAIQFKNTNSKSQTGSLKLMASQQHKDMIQRLK